MCIGRANVIKQRCDFTVLTPAFCMAVFRLQFHDGISKHHQQYKMDFIRLEKVTAVQTLNALHRREFKLCNGFILL